MDIFKSTSSSDFFRAFDVAVIFIYNDHMQLSITIICNMCAVNFSILAGSAFTGISCLKCYIKMK